MKSQHDAEEHILHEWKIGIYEHVSNNLRRMHVASYGIRPCVALIRESEKDLGSDVWKRGEKDYFKLPALIRPSGVINPADNLEISIAQPDICDRTDEVYHAADTSGRHIIFKHLSICRIQMHNAE
jgi:hypothetical protein